ncbi:divergent polysaccharide deacteylase family protein [Puniceibacterium sp. IMCC21224]|uniref:divergent polysaccharide deacteylase family protein n=1 Tax=Puniceibacterium sp. IMCC21224 TaxID=1618204 RepID=UPI00065CF4F5|nr:divergent polysaccharide deacteylase family protein [Puniceibacterium sp. IMCC21224]KMK67128.1 hypothetical protein IMCC21224_111992 [Puniceibacterium sp. IMCC21224]
MVKGYVTGALAGAVLSVVGAGAISVAIGVPSSNDAMAAPSELKEQTASTLPETKTNPEVAPTSSEAPSDVPPVRYEEAATEAPQSPAPPAAARRPGDESEVAQTEPAPLPQAGNSDQAVTSDTTPGSAPQVAPADSIGIAPDVSDSGASVAVIADTPVSPSVQSQAPRAPTAEPEPSIATEPAQPPAPQVPTEDSGLVAADEPPEAAPEMPPVVADADAEAVEADKPDEIAMVEPAPIAVSEPQAGTEGQPDAGTDRVAVAEPDAAPDAEPAPEPPNGEASAPALNRPAIGKPAVSLVDRDPAAATGRLPTIGATNFVPAPVAEDPAADDALPPLQRFAVPVEVTPDLPLMAIILLDNTQGPLGPDALDAFPFAITFAVDPASPNAASRMSGYRAQGFEVMALAAIPEGAMPSDVEVSLAASVAAVPEAVALLESPQGGLQATRRVSDQAAQFSGSSGRGLVFQPNGLNTAQALAARDGVAAGSVFRDFDGEGQDPRTIRRFLDGAAFRARQDGAVIVMGRLRPDTLSALLLWGLQDRAAQVSLVPVSAVLTR